MNGGTTTNAPPESATVQEAAMEPADERRDDIRPPGFSPRRNDRPQWSPPMNGGTTLMSGGQCLGDPAAAMEPADERRDDPGLVRG